MLTKMLTTAARRGGMTSWVIGDPMAATAPREGEGQRPAGGSEALRRALDRRID
jgi:hypothetical protein